MNTHAPARRTSVRSVFIAAAVGAAGFAGMLVALQLWEPALDLSLRDFPPTTRGFHQPEGEGETRFVWTSGHAEISLEEIDRSVEWIWTLDVKIWRPAGLPMPELIASADGVVIGRHLLIRDQVLDVRIPVRPGRGGSLLAIDVVPPFVPSPGDSRELGVALTSIGLRPDGGRFYAERRALIVGSTSTALIGAAAVLLGVPVLPAIALTLATAVGEAVVVTRGLARYGDFVRFLPIVAASVWLGALAIVWLTGRLRREALSTGARVAIGVSLAFCTVKMLLLLHPAMPIGDVLFHAHRLENVLGGDFYFTSVAPGAYAFPYPIFLYLSVAPLAFLTDDSVDRMALLRMAVTIADTGAGLALFWMASRVLGDARAGVLAVIWYHLLPSARWHVISGVMTNVYAQAWFVVAVALMVGLPIDARRRRTVVLVALATLAACLSHPSAAAILVTVFGVAAMLFYVAKDEGLRQSGRGLWFASLAAVAIAGVLFYGWFLPVYVSELGRVAAEATGDAAQPALRDPDLNLTPLDKLWIARDFARDQFGWPAMLLAVIGMWHLWRRPGVDRLRLLLVAWLAASGIFLLLGLWTDIFLRYHYAFFPAIALLAAVASVQLWQIRWPLRLGVLAALVVTAWSTSALWLRALVD